jgi:acyl-CoA synthetase (AMP-forming)/AMP-acid ligase II
MMVCGRGGLELPDQPRPGAAVHRPRPGRAAARHRHLAAFKVPRKITFLSADELPKTSTGKVQKYLLVRNRPGS